MPLGVSSDSRARSMLAAAAPSPGPSKCAARVRRTLSPPFRTRCEEAAADDSRNACPWESRGSGERSFSCSSAAKVQGAPPKRSQSTKRGVRPRIPRETALLRSIWSAPGPGRSTGRSSTAEHRRRMMLWRLLRKPAVRLLLKWLAGDGREERFGGFVSEEMQKAQGQITASWNTVAAGYDSDPANVAPPESRDLRRGRRRFGRCCRSCRARFLMWGPGRGFWRGSPPSWGIG